MIIKTILLLVLFSAAEAFCSSTVGIKLIEHKQIPEYESSVPSYGTDIHWSPRDSRFVLSNDTGIIEIPYKDGDFDDEASFASITGKFIIRGWVEAADGTWIVDARSMTLQTGPGNAYSLPVRLKGISGLSYDGKYFYISDMTRNTLNKIEIMDRNAVIIDSWKLTQGNIRDVLWTEEGFWLCDSRVLYLYSHDMKLLNKYRLEAEIDGIDMIDGDIWACGLKSPNIYRFSLIRGLIKKPPATEQP